MSHPDPNLDSIVARVIDPETQAIVGIDEERVNVADLLVALASHSVFARSITIFPGDTEEIAIRLLDRAFNFPLYFGFNWSAVDDCLRDLTWLEPGQKGYCALLVPWTADRGEVPMDLVAVLARTFEFCAEYWRERNISLKLILPSDIERYLAAHSPWKG